MRSGGLVSVVLPTYNRAGLLPRSVESILAQTDGDLEVVIVDDSSADDTESVVATFRDPRIRYLRLPRNSGLPAARNAGIAASRGGYIAFQDDDDEWHREKLARQRRALDRHPDAGVVYSDMRRVLADGRALHHRSPTIVRDRLVAPATGYWQSYMLSMQAVLARRACFDREHFDERLVGFEDLDLHLRLARHYAYVHMPEPLVDYHETGGLTSSRRVELKARRQLLRKYAAALLARERAFALREAMAVMLRRSLLPIVAQHMTPL